MTTITENLIAVTVILACVAYGYILFGILVRASTAKKTTDAELACQQEPIETTESGLVIIRDADLSSIESDAVLFSESVPAFIRKMTV